MGNGGRTINGLVVDIACARLKRGDSISEAMRQTGFDTTANFNCEFLWVTAQLPNGWRTERLVLEAKHPHIGPMKNTLPMPPADVDLDVSGYAVRYRRANGPLMAMMNRIGGSLEGQLKILPAGLRDQIEAVTAAALSRAMDLAALGASAPDFGPQGPVAMAMVSGAAGGVGGIATALAELPVTITIILHAIRQAAVANGFDADAPGIRAECLAVFAAGTPLAGDDGINTSFLGARLAVTGPALQSLIAKVAPRLAAALGPKLFAQSVPLLGAIAGAGLNAAYIRYYREIAEIRFGLLRLAERHGTETVLLAFQRASQPAAILKA